MALKTEAIGLAVMTELPLVIVNVQRAGPSTGMPTKIEQSDLLQAVYGRHGECPVPVLAARSPADCFDCAIEAFRIAVKYMTPVILLSDGGIGNSTEPWRIPDVASAARVHGQPSAPTRTEFHAYQRDENLARAWVRPGTPGLEHRIGGLEKDFLTGDLSGDPLNHQRMVEVRAAKVSRVARGTTPARDDGAASGDAAGGRMGEHPRSDRAGGRTGAGRRAVECRASSHLRYLNPFPEELGETLLRRTAGCWCRNSTWASSSRLLRDRYPGRCGASSTRCRAVRSRFPRFTPASWSWPR